MHSMRMESSGSSLQPQNSAVVGPSKIAKQFSAHVPIRLVFPDGPESGLGIPKSSYAENPWHVLGLGAMDLKIAHAQPD